MCMCVPTHTYTIFPLCLVNNLFMVSSSQLYNIFHITEANESPLYGRVIISHFSSHLFIYILSFCFVFVSVYADETKSTKRNGCSAG